jgi:IS5 family transposase
VICAAGYNLRWLLRSMVRLGLKVLLLRPVFEMLMAEILRAVSLSPPLSGNCRAARMAWHFSRPVD